MPCALIVLMKNVYLHSFMFGTLLVKISVFGLTLPEHINLWLNLFSSLSPM